jgi:hypothetical protein
MYEFAVGATFVLFLLAPIVAATFGLREEASSV